MTFSSVQISISITKKMYRKGSIVVVDVVTIYIYILYLVQYDLQIPIHF